MRLHINKLEQEINELNEFNKKHDEEMTSMEKRRDLKARDI